MSLRPPPSPTRSPSLTSQSDDDEEDIPDLVLPARTAQAPAPWDGDAASLSSALQRTSTLTPGVRPLPLANTLPHELLIHILKFVPSHTDLHASLLVSRQWCQCTVELLWHKPVFTKVSALFKLISVLSLARPDATSPLTFPYPVFLRRLNFALLGPDCTDSIFARLSLCTRLERLTLANCTALTSRALATILPQLRQLVALDCTNVHDLDDTALTAIAAACTRLQGVNLSNCAKLTDDGILALATHARLLRRVKLCGLTEVDDRAFAALALGCPLLIEMDLNGCVGVQDSAPRALFLHARQLRELRLAGCLQLSDNAFPLKPLPSPAPIGAAFQRSLNPATYALPQGAVYDHLRMLDLTSCASLTDDALDRIVSNAPRIRNLVLAKCISLSADCVEPIGRLGKHLHYLHLGHVAQLTDRSIRALAAACTRLRYIDLACCALLTDMSVFELAQLPKLRRIGLVRVTNLTDNALFALGDRHHTLERIHLSYCEGISVQAVHFLLQRLTRLTHLSLTGVPAFRRPELQQFCRSPPKEFNETQQRTFCVYSGKGVNDLRKYLASIASTPFPYVGTVQGESDSDQSTTPPPDAGFGPAGGAPGGAATAAGGAGAGGAGAGTGGMGLGLGTGMGGADVLNQLEGLTLGLTLGIPGDQEEDGEGDLELGAGAGEDEGEEEDGPGDIDGGRPGTPRRAYMQLLAHHPGRALPFPPPPLPPGHGQAGMQGLPMLPSPAQLGQEEAPGAGAQYPPAPAHTRPPNQHQPQPPQYPPAPALQQQQQQQQAPPARAHQPRPPAQQAQPAQARRGRADLPRYTFGQTDPSLFDFSYPAAPSGAGAAHASTSVALAVAGGGGGGASSSLPLAYPGPSSALAAPGRDGDRDRNGAFLQLPSPNTTRREGYTPSPVLSSAPTSLAPTPQSGSFNPSPVPPSVSTFPAGSSLSTSHGVASGSGSGASPLLPPGYVASRLGMQQPGTPDLDLAETGERGENAVEEQEQEEEEERILLAAPSEALSFPADASGPGAQLSFPGESASASGSGSGAGSRRSSMGSQSLGARRRGPLEFLFRRGRSREGASGAGEA